MNCANHPETSAAAFCRECGKPMCEQCRRPALGSVYCEEHLPATVPPPQPPPLPHWPGAERASAASAESAFAGSPYSAPPRGAAQPSPYATSAPGGVADPSVHPGLALILGFAPGVGAIYNGQYAKGLIHAVVFGLMISVLSNIHNGGSEAFVGIMLAAWVIYQAFEAYHTARKRRYGIAVEEFSSLLETGHNQGRFPVGAILLIGVGFILLLDTTEVISMEQFEKYWPAGLIVLGIYMLYARLSAGARGGEPRDGSAEVRQ